MNETPFLSNCELLAAPSRERLDGMLLDLLEASIDSSGIPRFLYLSPTRRKNREMASRLQQRRVSWRPQFLTPMRLAERVLDPLSNEHDLPIDPELKMLLIHKILQRPPDKGRPLETLRFKDFRTPVGVARHIAEALEALGRRGLAPPDAEADLNPAVAADLDHLSREYRDIARTHGLCDEWDIAGLAAEALIQGRVRIADTADLLVLDGFIAPDKVESEFVLAVARTFAHRKIIVGVPCHLAVHVQSNGWAGLPPDLRIFGHARAFFEALGLRKNAAVKFHGDSSAAVGLSASTPVLVKYPDRISEVKGIARTIKSLFFAPDSRETPAPEEFHVAVPRIDPYYRLFIEIFPRYGIPFNITRGIPLSSIPVVGLIFSLLDAVIVRDHPALFKFFSSGLVTVPVPGDPGEFHTFLEAHWDCIKPALQSEDISVADFSTLPESENLSLDIGAVDRLCRSAAVMGGRDFSGDWLVPTMEYFGGLMVEAGVSYGPDRVEVIRQEFHRALLRLWILQREFHEFDKLQGELPLGGVAALLESMIDRYGIRKNLIKSLTEAASELGRGGRIVLEKNSGGFNRSLAVLREIEHHLRVAGEHTTRIETIHDIFSDRCRKEMIQEAGDLAGVSISQVLEMRNITRPVVFLAGLTADDFPMTPPANFILSHGPESPAFARALDESRFMLRHVVENCGRVILSYPVSAGEEPLEPSPFIEDMRGEGKLLEHAWDADEAEPFCDHEILVAAGRSWREAAPVPWQFITDLTARHSRSRPGLAEHFQEEFRSALAASLRMGLPDRNGPYDGMIREARALATIGAVLDNPRFYYSVSMFNDYLRCPMLFLFKRILGLEPLREIPEEPEAAEVGSLVHAVLARFYDSRRKSGKGRITPGNRVEALGEMFETATEILDAGALGTGQGIDSWAARRRILTGLYSEERLNESSFRARVEQGLDLPRNRRGLLRILVDHEAGLDLPLHPTYVEFPFGFDGNPPLVISGVSSRPIRIRGKIDRIDVHGPAGDSSDQSLWIFDYKTGVCPTTADVKNGKDLQLAVYLLAAIESLARSSSPKAGACFLELRMKETDPRKAVIFTAGIAPQIVPQGMRSVWSMSAGDLDGVRNNIRNIDTNIRAGNFPRTPSASMCSRCDFVRACYRDEHRVRLLSETPCRQ